ncbi:hypothetical protein CK203_038378 [Vitis vinifera]|uniref:Uncharacterized protein n=1 Tax=Vitis vinifera TaxID=29760 RepID=A0A438HEQ6_VITVI|nr:hypothetical protein CK203_038378 [Vitis vinifera]
MEEIQLKHVSLWKSCMSTQVSACSLAQISKPKNHPVASLKVTRSCKEEQTEDLKNELKLELIRSVIIYRWKLV